MFSDSHEVMVRCYKINIHYDGAFLFEPFRYSDEHKVLHTITPIVSYDELVHFVETETGNAFTGLYYCVAGDDNLGHILPLLDKDDGLVFGDVLESYHALNVYVDYLFVDLSRFYEKPVLGSGEGDGLVDAEGEGEGISKTEIGETSRAGELVDEDESGDDSYVPDEDSDVESLASLDHLSEGEDEIRELRKGNPIAKIPTPSHLPDLSGNKHKEGEDVRTAALNEHDKFIKDLLEVLTSKDDEEMPTDLMQPPEPEVPKFPIYDTATHWRLGKPEVGQLFESHHQLRECLSYYALANGYSIWFERSCKNSIIARCGTRPGRKLKDPSKGKQRKAKRFPVQPQKCSFRCYATWMASERSFQIKSLKDGQSLALQ